MKKSHLLGAVGAFTLSFSFTPIAIAAPLVTWVGTADYTNAPSAEGDEDSSVGAFDTFQLGMGAMLFENAYDPNIEPGDPYTIDFQSYVVSHEYLSGGGGSIINDNNLDTSGTGSDGTYELTLTGTIDANYAFDFNDPSPVTGGSINLNFDTTPDFNFGTDSGFTNGDAILQGDIIAGGTVDAICSALGGLKCRGFTELLIMVTDFDQNVFDPDTFVSGESFFTLQVRTPGATADFVNGISSVLGNSVDSDDLVVAADGNISFLQPVPLPSAVWLFGTGLLGLVGIAKRKKAA